MKKKLLAVAMGAMLAAGAANAVTVNHAGLGDLLVAPSYFIGGGWQSELKVINTSLTQSVVAKVVIHDNERSEERLDFLIYLSPGDVWVGTLASQAAAANGQTTRSVVTSSDDSILLPNSNNFATAATPAVIVSGAGEGRAPLTNIGYITIIESQAFDIAPNAPGVSKAAIKAAFDAAPAVVADTNTPNVLAGFLTISNTINGQNASLPTLALADYNNRIKQNIGVDSSLGAPRSQATVADIEDALWKTSFIVPYVVGGNQSSLVSFTFPTKLTYRNVISGQYPFQTKVAISADVFDYSENRITGPAFNISPLPAASVTSVFEHDWLAFGSQISVGSFTAGWANVRYANPTVSVGQTSAPSVNLGKSGGPGVVTYINTIGPEVTWHYAPSN